MHRTKDALKLLACLLSRVHGARQQHLFFGLARLYAKHGLNKDALVSKLPSLCSTPPDRRTLELLKSMAEVVLPNRPLGLRAPRRSHVHVTNAQRLFFAAVHACCCRATVTEVHRRGRPGPLHACAPDHRSHVQTAFWSARQCRRQSAAASQAVCRSGLPTPVFRGVDCTSARVSLACTHSSPVTCAAGDP